MPVSLPRFSSTRLTSSLKEAPAGQRNVLIHQTQMFRHGACLTPLVDEMLERFPEGAPVFCYAASDGSEPYSVAMKLINSDARMTQGQRERFFPLHARDISADVLEIASHGAIVLSDDEPSKIRKECHVPFDSMFERQRYFNGMGFWYKVLPMLRDKVSFSVADIAKDAESCEISEKPCVVFFRNAWYHLYDMGKFARDLFNALKPGSLLVVGDTEVRNNPLCPGGPAAPAIIEAGFNVLEPSEDYQQMVFERP